jgi:hypothetical protein
VAYFTLNTAAGGTNGAACTHGNSGPGSGYYLDNFSGSGTATYDSSVVYAPLTMSYNLTAASQYVIILMDYPAALTSTWFRCWVNFSALPAAPIARSTGTSGYTAVNCTGGGSPKIQAAVGSGTKTGTYVLQANTWYRIELQTTQGSTATSGVTARCETYLYSAVGAWLDHVSYTASSANTVYGQTGMQFGSTSSYTGTWRYAGLAGSDQGWIGPSLAFRALSISNTAEGGSDGTAVSLANTGGASGDAPFSITAAPALTFSAASAYGGTLGYYLAPVTGNTSPSLNYKLPTYVSASTAYVVNVRGWFSFTAIGTAINMIYTSAGGATGSGVSYIQLTTAGKLSAVATSATTGTGTAVLTANTWYRIEAQFTFGTSVSRAAFRLHDVYGTQLDAAQSTANGTVTYQGLVSIGNQNGQTAVPFSMDNLAISDQGWIGGGTAAPLTLSTSATGYSGGGTGGFFQFA